MGGSTQHEAAQVDLMRKTQSPPPTSAISLHRDRRERRLLSSIIPRRKKDVATQAPVLKGLYCFTFHRALEDPVCQLASPCNRFPLFLILPCCVFFCGFSRGYSSNKSWSSSSFRGGGRGRGGGGGSRSSAGDASATRRPGLLAAPMPQSSQRPFLKPAFSHLS